MFPRGALIYITNACKLHCNHCGIVETEKPQFMSMHCFESTMRFLKEKRCYVVAISGGDPILHPQLFDFLKLVRSCNMLPVLGLSGLGLTSEHIELIANSGVGCVQVSLDGSCEEVNSILRGKNNFKAIVDTIKILQTKHIKVNIAMCLCKENLTDFRNMLDLFFSLNAYQIKIQFWQRVENSVDLSELSVAEKKYVKQLALDFSEQHKLKGWIAIDSSHEEDCSAHNEKFIVFPNGDIRNGEQTPVLGNIITSYKEIIAYYE